MLDQFAVRLAGFLELRLPPLISVCMPVSVV
jgi:hypothetical protein